MTQVLPSAAIESCCRPSGGAPERAIHICADIIRKIWRNNDQKFPNRRIDLHQDRLWAPASFIEQTSNIPSGLQYRSGRRAPACTYVVANNSCPELRDVSLTNLRRADRSESQL